MPIKMNIWVVYTYEPILETDGIDGQFRYRMLCETLAEKGHTVHWVQSDFDHINKITRVLPGGASLLKVSKNLTIHLVKGSGYKNNVSIARIFHNRRLANGCVEWIGKQSYVPDIIIAGLPSVEVVEVFSDYSATSNIPLVIDAHDQWPEIYLKVFPIKLRRLAKVLMYGEFSRAKKSFARAASFTAVSETYLNWIVDTAGRTKSRHDRVFELGYAVPDQLLRRHVSWEGVAEKYQIPRDRKLVSFVGSLGNFYDVETIARAARRLQRSGRSDVHFVIAGSGERLEAVKKIAAQGSNITITGRVRQDEARVLLENSSLAVAAYTRNATQSLSYKIFEYMAAGVPQLCSLEGEALRLLVAARCGVGYKAGNEVSLELAVVRLLDDNKLRAYMSSRAKAVFAQSYSMSSIMQRFAVHLEDLRAELGSMTKISNVLPEMRAQKSLRIIYLHQHFSVLQGSTSTRSYEFARALVLRGHSVKMICGANELSGLKLPAEPSNDTRIGIVDGIEVLALPLPYSNHQSLVRRAYIFLLYAWKSMRLVLRERADVIFATSTPLTIGIPGIASKLLGRDAKFIFEVRDLWPELPRALGLSNPVALIGMDLLEFVTYRVADRCIGLSPGIVAGIRRRCNVGKRVELIPNGCDLRLFGQRPRAMRDSLGLGKNDFVAVYAGAHGVANGLDAVLDCAQLLMGRKEIRIKFLMIGEGRERSRLISRKEKEGLDNCIFWPVKSKLEVADILGVADCALMIFSNTPAIYYGTSPNKFFDYIASALPVIVNYPGWMADMICEAECGVFVAPDDPASMAEHLIRLSRDCRIVREMGKRARNLAESRFARDFLARAFVGFIEEQVVPNAVGKME